MAFERQVNGFDQCESPVCPEDVVVGSISVTCTEDATLHVVWNLSNPFDRDLNFNAILWSCDNQDFNNTAYPTNDEQPYTTSFDILGCSGIIYLKAKIRVGTTFIESDVETFNTKLCGSNDEGYAVPVIWCGDCPDIVSTPPSYSLYVKAPTIPSLPVYFGYGGFCWYLTSDDNKILIEDLPVGSILTNIDTVFSSCSNCCLKLDCPSSWAELPEDAQSFAGERSGTFYFEYQTYNCPDRLYVIKNYTDEDCNAEGAFTPPPEKILFDTGCVRTNKQNSPSFFVSDSKCINYDAPTYGFCITVRESELPIGIINDCDCSSSCYTQWRICVVDPDGETTSWAGSNECLCDDVEVDYYYCAGDPGDCLCYDSTSIPAGAVIFSTHLTLEDCEANCACPTPPIPPLPDFALAGHINDVSISEGIWGDGTYIYLASLADGLRAYTFDGTNFTSVLDIDDGGVAASAVNVWGDGNYIYLANGNDGLRAYTFDNPSVINVGHIDDGGYAYGIWGDGTNIYSANVNDGLRAHTFDGAIFTNVGNIDDGGEARTVWGDGTNIYLANDFDGLRAYTFDNPGFTNVGHIDDGGEAFGVWGDGNYIYLANTLDGLRAYTFDNPGFTNVGHINEGGSAYRVWGDGTYIYLANWPDGLRAYTFDGSDFTPVSHIDDGGNAMDIFGDGNYIYLANGFDGLRAYTFV